MARFCNTFVSKRARFVDEKSVAEKKRRPGNTRVSLHPLSFAQAIAALVKIPKRVDSSAEASDKTTSPALESEQAEPQTDLRRESSDD